MTDTTTSLDRVASSSETFVSYAQNAEDVMLWRALRGVRNGCYVDVGAAEPVAESVTWAFYLRGWRGVNMEPAAGAFQRLSEARPDEVNLNIAAGDHDGTTAFFLIGGGNGLSTAVADQADFLSEQGWSSTRTEVPVRTLASVVAEHIHGPVHFLKIDAEGSERSVLTGADLRRFRPWIILVEATAPNSQEATHQHWEGLLLEADYKFVWFDGLNRFYVAAERMELGDAFKAPPNVFDNYIRCGEAEAVDTLRRYVSEAAANSSLAQGAAAECYASLEEERQHGRALAANLVRALEERDAWAQELYESNRHASYLTQVRQGLLDEKGIMHALVTTLQANLAEESHVGLRLRDENEKLQGTLRECDLTILRLREDFEAQRRVIEDMTSAMVENSKYMEAFRTEQQQAHQTSLARERETARQDIEVAHRDAEAARQGAEMARLHALESEKWVEALRASTSWRLSSPVRAIGRLLGR